MEKKQIHLRIPVSASTRTALKKLALDNGDLPLAEYVRQLIQAGLEVKAPNAGVDMSEGIETRRGGAGRKEKSQEK